jgi:hypothetical protein
MARGRARKQAGPRPRGLPSAPEARPGGTVRLNGPAAPEEHRALLRALAPAGIVGRGVSAPGNRMRRAGPGPPRCTRFPGLRFAQG